MMFSVSFSEVTNTQSTGRSHSTATTAITTASAVRRGARARPGRPPVAREG